MSLPVNLLAAVVAGTAAAIASTLAQVAMWIVFTDTFPAILWRDTRFAAAIVLGRSALDGAWAPATLWIAASLVHIVLSIVYALLLSAAIRNLRLAASLLAGGLFGVALYLVNMHGFTSLYPWFEQSRDPITLVAHLVFGVTAGYVYRRVEGRTQRD